MKSELRENMYIRTKDGIIDKILKLNKIYVKGVLQKNNSYAYDLDSIIKASYNIIDILEEGDYVNGKYVDEVAFVDGDYYIKTKVSNTNNYDYLPVHLIKTIVTKEQFEQIQYRIGD